MKDNDYDLNDRRYLRLNKVLELIPVSRSTWYLWIQRGIAPQPKKLSIRVAAWKIQDIRILLEEIDRPDWEEKIKGRLRTSS